MFLNYTSIIYNNSFTLPKHICSNIIKYCLAKQNIKEGLTKHPSSQKIRNSYVVWNDETWIKNTVMKYIMHANKQLQWNFDITSCEDIQFTIYNRDQHYDWHMDSNDSPYQHGKNKGLIRKISASILLNDNFEGGDFLFNFRDEIDPNIIKTVKNKNIGTAIVFPSFMRHKVTPVTKGTRYSLVCWSLGKPFK